MARAKLLRCLSMGILLAGCAASGPTAPPPDAAEEIYVLRSLPELPGPPTERCAAERTGFTPVANTGERRFTMWAVQTRRADGRAVDVKAQPAGDLNSCLGTTPDPAVFNFRVDGTVGGIAVAGTGTCRVLARDTPAKGLFPVACSVPLTSRPPYVGGMLTSSTMSSRATSGGDTDPPGYTQASIATIRLWKSR